MVLKGRLSVFFFLNSKIVGFSKILDSTFKASELVLREIRLTLIKIQQFRKKVVNFGNFVK